MPDYKYEALDKRGKHIKGTIGATSKEAAVNKLRKMGYFPIKVSDSETSEQGVTVSTSSKVSHRIMKPEPAWKSVLGAILGKERESGGAQKFLGVELENDSLKLAEMDIDETGVRIGRILAARVPIEGGKIQGAFLASAVRSLIQQHKITTKKGVYCVPRESVFVDRLRLPRVSEPRLARIVLYEANQRIPSSPRNIIMYQVLGASDKRELDVLLAGMEEEAYDGYVRLVRKIGLRPAGISLCSLAESETQSLRPLILKPKPQTIRFLLLPSEYLT